MKLSIAELEAERGQDDQPEPFELDLGDGAVVNLPHPKDIPFDVIDGFASQDPRWILRSLMGDEAFDQLAELRNKDGKKRVTLGILETILDRYNKHYGLGDAGEGDASPRSLSDSAGRSKRTSRAKATA